MMKKLFLLIPLILLLACTSINHDNNHEKNISDHRATMATLYTYYADEYKALCYQAFNIARERVDNLKIEFPDRDDMAIVVDIDETVLDNSPHQAFSIATDSAYPYMWTEWCNTEKAQPVPGALEFLRYADEKGFNIFYISNRKEKYVKASTLNNLRSLGFPQIVEDHFMLRLDHNEDNPDPSDKQPRRDQVTTSGHEIVLLIGDNLGDFYTDESNQKARRTQMESYKKEFGYKFIILPNAMYGHWPASIGIHDSQSIDSLIIEMKKVFK